MKEKTGFKRLIACFMAIILFLTSAPLASLAGIDNFKFKLQVNAIDQVDYSDKSVFFFVQTSLNQSKIVMSKIWTAAKDKRRKPL